MGISYLFQMLYFSWLVFALSFGPLLCHFHFRIFKIVYKIKVTRDFKTPTLDYEENVKLMNIMNSV